MSGMLGKADVRHFYPKCFTMTVRLKSIIGWLAISALAGALGSFLLDLDFWASVLIVGLALVANGVLANLEDRGKFND